jgi:hypothetical protein
MLSEHFSLSEFTYSQTASRMGLDNTPTPEAHVHLQQLAQVMEKVRDICGANSATGGSSNSAHMSGLACDFIIPAFGTPLEVCNALIDDLYVLTVSQLIREFDNPEGSGWVHLAICPPGTEPACECLTINNSGTTTGFA